MENSKKEKLENILIIFLLFTLAFIFLFQSPLCPFFPGESLTDSSVFRTIGWQMTKGLIPYKDTFDHKGPILYLINYVGTKVSFDYGVWFIEMIFVFITFLFVYKISRIFNSVFYSFCSIFLSTTYLFIYFEKGNLVEEYAMAFISISLYIFLDYFINNNIKKCRIVICGMSFASVLMLRQNMISLWAVFCTGILIKCISCKKYKELINYMLLFFLGFIIVAVPILIWLVYKNAISDFIFDYFIFNTRYSVNESNNALNVLSAIKYFSLNPIMLISIALLLLKIKDNKFFNILYIVYIVLTLILINLSGNAFPHYGMELIIAYSYPISLFFNLICKLKITNIIKITICSILVIVMCLPSYLMLINNIISKSENTFYTDKNIIITIKSNTNEDEKILVLGNRNSIYLLTKRMPASKYSYQIPISKIDERIADKCLKDIVEQKPKFIVMYEANKKIEAYIDNNYHIFDNLIDNLYILN